MMVYILYIWVFFIPFFCACSHSHNHPQNILGRLESTPPYFNVERLLYYLSERIFNKTKVLGAALPGRDVRQDDFNVLKYVTVYDSAKLLTLFF
jgi:hypothetical protein